MIRIILGIISSFSILVGMFLYAQSTSATITFTPGLTITLSGSNEQVYFDVADDIYNAGTTVSGPVLHTDTLSFSGAFYLTGAGWVDFSTGSYSVIFDCGSQSLSNLTGPCTLSGTAYGEVVGDVIFDRKVEFDPLSGYLSGTIETFLGTYDLSGITLPLYPAGFSDGNVITAEKEKSLTISGASRYDGPSPWRIHAAPIGGVDRLCTGLLCDFSHASVYRIEIIDPNESSTVIDDFLVLPGAPSHTLDAGIASTVRQSFCDSYPLSCIDGSSLMPMTLTRTQSSNPVIANGDNTYNFSLKARDRYGNLVDTGALRIDYADAIRDIQDTGTSPYFSYGSGYALKTLGSLHNYLDGAPTTGDMFLNLGDISYQIASIAPTSGEDTLSLSGILYTDTSGNLTNVINPIWKDPLVFQPWYRTSLAAGPIVIGSEVGFTTNFVNATPSVLPTSPTAIYDLLIGSNMLSSFADFTSGDTIWCTKYRGNPGAGECNWIPDLYDPVIISTSAGAFSGVYTYGGYEPPPEQVSYQSYITYDVSGTRILYPSTSASFGNALPGVVHMKILGQQNISTISGVPLKNTADLWNALHKKIALLSRNRTDYSDVDYDIRQGDITLSYSDFATPTPKKRTIVTLGGDITLLGDMPDSEKPLAIIALTDGERNGGNIIIDPDTIDIHVSLLAEKSIFSSGANQLYIHGSVLSYNTTSDSVCPYYVSPCVDPEKYNLGNLRVDFLTTPSTLSSESTPARYPSIPLIFEYDSRTLLDPPPGLEK